MPPKGSLRNSTDNNGLESTNNVIKNEVTMRNQLPLLDFCREICTWLETQSRRRNPADVNYISFSEQATFATCDWTEAFSRAHGSKKQLRLRNRIYIAIEHKVSGDLNDTKTDNYIKIFTNLEFESFDLYTSTSNSISMLVEDSTRREGYKCTCRRNTKKKFRCKHSLGFALLRDMLVPPPEAKCQQFKKFQCSLAISSATAF